MGFGKVSVKLGFGIKIERGGFYVDLQNDYRPCVWNFSSAKMAESTHLSNFGKNERFALIWVK